VRLWTVHPRYLDSVGLVALWREGLLAQAVLRGLTRGYRNHPQLIRFRAQEDPIVAIGAYLGAVHEESLARGYRFEAAKIVSTSGCPPLIETRGQLLLEWRHLLAKLAVEQPDPHPLFRIVDGPVREWEKAHDSASPGERR
jgi:hypothetical protein